MSGVLEVADRFFYRFAAVMVGQWLASFSCIAKGKAGQNFFVLGQDDKIYAQPTIKRPLSSYPSPVKGRNHAGHDTFTPVCQDK